MKVGKNRDTKRSADAGEQWHEHDRIHAAFDKSFFRAFDEIEMLLALLVQRQNHSTTRAKLLEQRLRRAFRRRRYDDRIERCDFRHADMPVSVSQVDIGHAGLAKVI